MRFVNEYSERAGKALLSESEISILKIILANTICSVQEVYGQLAYADDSKFLQVLRQVHQLQRRGLLVQLKFDGGTVYRATRKTMLLRKYL